MSAPLPLTSAFASVTLDGNGNGQASAGPNRPREHWQVTAVSVSVSSNANESEASVYIGNEITQASFLGSTATGSTGDTCGVADMDIQSGMQVFAKWSGGDPGSTAVMTVFGTYTFGPPQ